jgi:DNA-binding transcriptional LysR family regulator
MALPQPLPDLEALDLLVTVGEVGSITAAAQVHGVTQPAASMRLRSLERVLRLKLLERSRSGSRLTPAGEATVEWAAQVVGSVGALLAGAAALRTDPRSHVRVAASLTVAEYLLPAWLQQLAVGTPGTAVSLDMGNTAYVARLVTEGGADLGFIEGARPPGRLRWKDLLQDSLVVVVAPSHPWSRRRRPLGPRDLATTALLLREEGSGTRDTLVTALAAHGLAPTSLMQLGSTTALKAAAASGAGPAVLSARAVEPELRSGHLVQVPCAGVDLSRTIRAVWARERPLSDPAHRLLAIASGHRAPKPTSTGGMA